MAIAAFSSVINLLFLVPAFFSLQVFDRVVSTESRKTLPAASSSSARPPKSCGEMQRRAQALADRKAA